MKRLLTLAMTVAMLLVVATPASAKKYGETLRILAIGNSFSDDGMEHLPALLKDLGVLGLNALALVYMKHAVIAKKGNLLLLVSFFLFLLNEFPEDNHGRLLALAYLAALSFTLLEGQILAGSAKDHLIK